MEDMLSRIDDWEPVSLRGISPGRTGRKSRRVDGRRTCGRRGCTTVLSAYNPGLYCWQHETPRAFAIRGSRQEEELPGAAQLQTAI